MDITITEDMVGHKLGEFAPYVVRTLDQSPRCRLKQRPRVWNTQYANEALQDTEELHIQADEEQVEAQLDMHAIGVRVSLQGPSTLDCTSTVQIRRARTKGVKS